MNRNDESLCKLGPQSGLNPEKILDFGIPVNPLGPSKKAERKIIKHLSAALRDPGGAGDLIQTLARFHGLGEEEILLGAGANEFIYALPRVLSIRRALMVTPISGVYEKALEKAGHDPKTQIDYFEAREEDGFEVDANGLISSLTYGYDALYLANPGFPTGIPVSKEDLLRTLAQTDRHRTWFILDETLVDFVEEQSLKKMVNSSTRLLVLRSFSHFFALRGLQVGYLLGNRETIGTIRNALPPRTVNPLGQIAASESLQDPAHIRRTKEWLPKERERFAQGLRSIPGFVPYPGTVNFLLVQLLPFLGIDGRGLQEELLKQGFRIEDCRSYPALVPYFIAIAVRTRRENNLLIKALRKIVGDLLGSRNAVRPAG